MSSKEVYGVTVSDPALNLSIHNHQKQHNLDSKTEAAREMLKLYSIATPKEKEKLAKRLHWMQHRNKSFRTLPSVDPSLPKTKPVKKHKTASQPLPKRKAHKQEAL
jgi:hypothetical protein